MYTGAARIALWSTLAISVAVAAVPGANDHAGKSAKGKGGQAQHRRSIDPPVAAVGKLGQDLFLAIDRRDTATVKSLIAKGADPNCRNGLEFTPLYIAAASHQPEVVNVLLSAGAKFDADSPYGTPLMFAAATANTVSAKDLLARGANVNASRVDGITVLMMASNAGSPEFVAELLKRKADVNAKNYNDETALFFAARAGHEAVTKMLLDAGAKVDLADSDKQTPLMIAAANGHAAVVRMLLQKGAKPNATDAQGRTALILATSAGDYPEVVKTLLDGGAKANAADAKHRTAAAFAVVRGHEKSAALLGEPTSAALAAVGAPRDARQAVRSSLGLLQSSMGLFNKSTNCISCHQEGLGRIATGAAKERGFVLDGNVEKALTGRIRGALNAMQPLHAQALKNPEAMKQVPLIEINEVTSGDTWLLSGMAANGDAPTEATAAMAMVVARQQTPDGFWSFSVPRVPMQSSFFTFTALAIRSLQAYGPKASAAEIAERIQRAKGWLAKAPAQTSEDRASRLLGLKWAGATGDEMASAINAIKADQRPDGGWSQLPDLRSDAYATGQALYALRTGGMSTSDPIYKKGLEFLLRTQETDGSWFVSKRAIPLNNYFSAGFPHGSSQYASFNGTCWATLALLETLPKLPRVSAKGR
jgi:ankyrin repeat protein